jgi:glycosyltransferase involved in cell wall biosynthesis
MAASLTHDTSGAPNRSAAPAGNQQRSRVLHVNSGNLYGGVETILTTLARLRNLCPTMEPHYAVCHQGRLSRELRESGVPVYELGQVRISRPWTVSRARRRLREILAHQQFELVVCHMPWSLAVFGPAVNAAGKRLAFWAHAFHDGSGWLEWMARRATPDVAIATSRYAETGLANIFPEVPHAVIYPPVALTASTPSQQSRSTLRTELGADDRTVVIIQVSRMEAWKGHSSHLRALVRLKQLPTPWVCWMVGGAQRPSEQKYLAQLMRLAEELGIGDRVRFLGQRSDVPDLLAAADIFCQPNQTPEPFGIAFVEALWAGRPVIAAALGGALEIIDESCGVLIPPGDVDRLADSLQRMIEHPEFRERLEHAGAPRAILLCDPTRQMSILDRISRNGEGNATKS